MVGHKNNLLETIAFYETAIKARISSQPCVEEEIKKKKLPNIFCQVGLATMQQFHGKMNGKIAKSTKQQTGDPHTNAPFLGTGGLLSGVKIPDVVLSQRKLF